MILVIDSGNTYTKLGQFNNGKLNKIYQNESIHEIIHTINRLKPDKVVIGSVNFSTEKLQKGITDIPIFSIDAETPIPFKLNYKTPETLGIDRKAVIAYAWEQYPKKNIQYIFIAYI